MSVTLYRGDCRAVLPTLPAESVQLVLTSPPYNVGWDYADAGRGDRLALAEYLNGLLAPVVAECYRVLRPGGVLAVNLPPTIRVKGQYRAWLIEREPSFWPRLESLTQGVLDAPRRQGAPAA